MGFTSVDDLVTEMTGGKQWRQDWSKIYAAGNVYGAGTVVAGRWYDLTGYQQNEYIHGSYVYNGHFNAGLGGWTTSSSNIAWDAANTAAAKSGGASETITQNTDCVNGTTYELSYTIAGYTGSGNITPSLGGTNGTNRSANLAAGTFENIVCGATGSAPLTFTFATTISAARIENIMLRRLLSFTPYTDSAKGREAGIWHGGNVSGDTKHLINMGAWTTAAVGAGSIIYLVDLLGAYPKIQTASGSSQTLTNTLTLPRYTDGKGVRAFITNNTTNGLNAQNFAMSYTAPGPVAGRSLGAQVANTASAISGHMSTTGVAAGNFGPFLPLSGGDTGIVSVESAQFSAASASAGFVDLVLCKPLAAIPITTAFIAAERDLLTQLPSLPRIYDGAVLGLIIQSGAIITAATQWQGYIETAWG
jgi:hypothetical protein